MRPARDLLAPSFELDIEVSDINDVPIARLWVPNVPGPTPLKLGHELYLVEEEAPLNALRLKVSTR